MGWRQHWPLVIRNHRTVSECPGWPEPSGFVSPRRSCRHAVTGAAVNSRSCAAAMPFHQSLHERTDGRTSVTGREVGHGPWRRLCAAAGDRYWPVGRFGASRRARTRGRIGVALAASVVASSAAGAPAVALEPRSSMAFKVPLTPVARGGRGATHFPQHRFVLLTPAPRDRAQAVSHTSPNNID